MCREGETVCKRHESTAVLILAAILDLVLVFRRKCILVLVTFKSLSYSHIKLLSFPSQAQGPPVLCLQLHNSQACST